MKMPLLLVALICITVSKAQNVFTQINAFGSSVLQNQLAFGGQPTNEPLSRLLFFRATDGRLAYMDQGDTVYLVKDGETAGLFSNDLSRLVQNGAPSNSLTTFAPWGTDFPHIATLETRNAAAPIGTGFFRTLNGRMGFVYNGDSTFLVNLGQSDGPNTLPGSFQSSSILPGNAISITSFPSLQAGLPQLSALIANDTVFSNASFGCGGCFTVTAVQPGNTLPAIHFGPATIDQQFDVNSLTASDPTDHRAFLKAIESDSTMTITSFTLFTGTAPNRTNINGAISIQFPNGQRLGISADSLMSIIGWNNNPNGEMTLQARTIFTSANFVDNASISAHALTLSDLQGTKPTLPPGTLEYLLSNSPHGTGILIENTNADPDANTTITLTQGAFSNSIMTVSAYSASPDRPAGALLIQSGGHNGMIFNSTNDGSITFCVDDEPVARMDAKKGLVLLVGYFRLPRVTTEAMRVMTDMEPGDQVFNTDRQTIFTYTADGWKYSRMHKFQYHKLNQPQ
jgi:hypothetical protein